MAFRLSTLSQITSHPLTRHAPLDALGRYARFHIGQRLHPNPYIHPWLPPLKLLVKKGWAGVVGNVYTGLYDFEEMAFLLHLLRPDDLFVDIGANAGVYSLLAAGVCQSNVLAIEPVPATFSLLEQQIALNGLQTRIDARQIGLGTEEGLLYFSAALGTMNHVISEPVPGEASVEVPVSTLDLQLSKPARLIKLDTEGFELPVLLSASATLAQPELAAVIIELNASGQRYGYADEVIDALLKSHEFYPHRYHPFERRLEALPHWRQDQYNSLYVREAGTLTSLLKAAPKNACLGVTF